MAPVGPSWLSPYRWGLGGPVAGGRQWWSWISLRDEVRAIVHVLDHEIAGPVNLVGPAPVTNREFTKVLGRVLRRPAVIPIPGFVLSVLLGRQLADALVLQGQRVTPKALMASGFEFKDPDLEAALHSALRS
jgi:NAD dependent epimerase/dehydratase family enzyme